MKGIQKPTVNNLDEYRHGFSAANRTYRALANFDFGNGVTADNGDKFNVIKFSRDAQTVADSWANKITEEAEALQTTDEVFSAYLWKIPKSCYAIALIFHCLENINNSPFPNEIEAETARKAIAYTDVLISHARRVFALGENQIFALADSLIGKIRAGALEQGFTVHQIVRKQWSGLSRKEIVDDVVALLEEYGYLRHLLVNAGPGGGRPTKKYYFHSSLEPDRGGDRCRGLKCHGR